MNRAARVRPFLVPVLVMLGSTAGLPHVRSLAAQEASNPFAGEWSGVLDAGSVRYPLVFHLGAGTSRSPGGADGVRLAGTKTSS